MSLLNNPSSFIRALGLGLAVVLALTASVSHAEPFMLTDKQGRSIKADVLSVENEKVKLKRDDGQSFELPLSSLNEETQRSLKAWAAKAAAAIPDGAITVELSRGAFDTSKSETAAIITIQEDWGYSVTVSNRGSKPISNLKFEYVLFVKPDLEPGKDRNAAKFKRATGTNTITGLAGGTKTVFRTNTIKIYKQKLKPGWFWDKTNDTQMIRDTLYGIWIKAYVGDQLVAETCSPDSLAKTEKGP